MAKKLLHVLHNAVNTLVPNELSNISLPLNPKFDFFLLTGLILCLLYLHPIWINLHFTIVIGKTKLVKTSFKSGVSIVKVFSRRLNKNTYETKFLLRSGDKSAGKKWKDEKIRILGVEVFQKAKTLAFFIGKKTPIKLFWR